jgi:hypothetical protein
VIRWGPYGQDEHPPPDRESWERIIRDVISDRGIAVLHYLADREAWFVETAEIPPPAQMGSRPYETKSTIRRRDVVSALLAAGKPVLDLD